MKKPGRNDLCSCGSGKKFKKCCEAKQSTRQLTAERVSQASSFASASRITQFFKANLPPASPPPATSELEEKKESQ